MRKFCFALFLGVVLCSLALLSQAKTADVNGDWELTVQSQRGPIVWSVNFAQDGEKLAVTMVGPKGNEFKGEGTIQGSEIEWSITRKSPQGDQITIIYKGKVEGATMSGQADMGGVTTVDWTAKKK
jgi:hypothetical protein